MSNLRRNRSLVVLAVTFGATVLVTAGAVVARAGSGHASTVSVTESEMKISAKPTVVDAGKVTFVVRNAGTVEHEMVVIRGGTALKVKGFRVPETASVGEVGELKAGATKSVTLNLRPGKYLLICNILGHYMLGMHSVLTVR
jgi:uncharacterized cupredoxin-like copper-binding protein